MKNRCVAALCLVFLLCTSCSSSKDDTAIPDPQAIENLTEASLNILNEAIDEDPSNDALYYKRASFYYRLKNNAKALADINKAIDLENEKGEYYLLLGQITYASGNVIAARDAALKAEQRMDKVPALLVLQANVYMDLKDSLKYKNYIQQAIQMVPFKADADYIQARQALLERDSSRSVQFLQAAVKKDPDYLPAYKEIIKIYLNKAMYDSSMSYVLNGIRISHQEPLFYEAEGRFFEKMKLNGAAESAYQIALKYSDKNPLYYTLLGNLKYRTGELDKALSWYSLLLQTRPNDLELLKQCADIAFRAKEWSRAVTYYGKLMARDSTHTAYENQYKLAVKYANDDMEEVHEEQPVVIPVAPDPIPQPIPKPAPQPQPQPASETNGVKKEVKVLPKKEEVKAKKDTSGKDLQRSVVKEKTDTLKNE